ncbi:MAG: helix-turn-helix transcriptional regulator [Deltaproteobacteria bacterium]|nr:helix-turn-helix transcriptional regulator [Deltaproteobacteria bacterium]
MNIKRRDKLIELLKNKEYRDAFVSEHIDTGLPFQIKALREEREWSQEKLGNKAGMHQERISALEDPNYAKFTLKTLKRLASAFDIALMVVFVPFSKLLDWESNLSPESLRAASFEKDNFSKPTIAKEERLAESIRDKINPPMVSQLWYAFGEPPKLPEALIFSYQKQGIESGSTMEEQYGIKIGQLGAVNLVGSINRLEPKGNKYLSYHHSSTH